MCPVAITFENLMLKFTNFLIKIDKIWLRLHLDFTRQKSNLILTTWDSMIFFNYCWTIFDGNKREFKSKNLKALIYLKCISFIKSL